MAFEATLLVQDPDDDRAHLRRKLRLSAGVRAFGGHAIDVIVLEVTPRGFAAQIAEPVSQPIAAGQEVWLTVDDAEPVGARVMWAAEGRIGARFLSDDAVPPVGTPLPPRHDRGFGITIDRAPRGRWYLPQFTLPPGSTPAQKRRHILIVGFVVGWALTLLLVGLWR